MLWISFKFSLHSQRPHSHNDIKTLDFTLDSANIILTSPTDQICVIPLYKHSSLC